MANFPPKMLVKGWISTWTWLDTLGHMCFNFLQFRWRAKIWPRLYRYATS